jgi:phospholipid-binding lipoprotein MlaA
VPDLAKKSVRDFLANLETPAILVNDVLQGEMRNAAVTVGRFAVNTLIGCAGFFDPATSLGLERHSADFGQTLARTGGFGSGPYLVVPLLGPTTVRDGLGTIVDIALQPAIYLLGPAPLVVASVQEGTVGLTMREKHGDDLKRLEQASLDYYAALRSAYYQDRMAKLGVDGDEESAGVAAQDTTSPATDPIAATAAAGPAT